MANKITQLSNLLRRLDGAGIIPGSILIVFVFITPVVISVAKSFMIEGSGIGFNNYAKLFESPLYIKVIINTCEIALLVTLSTTVLGYGIAYLIVRSSSRAAKLLLFAACLPLWTSFLTRSFALMLILGRNGLINRVLLQLHLIESPLRLVFNTFGVVVGMDYILIPYSVLTITVGLGLIDPAFERSARSLGASPLRAFVNVLLPLSAPSIALSATVIFFTSLGFFVTPMLLGGAQQEMIGTLIATQISVLGDFSFAAAVSSSTAIPIVLWTVLVVIIVLRGHYFATWQAKA